MENSRESRIQTYAEFWPFYLSEHKNTLNRQLHFVGTSLGFILLILSVFEKSGWLVFGAFLSGYAFAWFGHFIIEKNRPATFRYPIWSFASDWKMWFYTLIRKPLT